MSRTICDGVRTQSVGELTFEMMSALVDEIVTVSDEDVLDAVRFYATRGEALAVEPTGALTLAALLAAPPRRRGAPQSLPQEATWIPCSLAAVLSRP